MKETIKQLTTENRNQKTLNIDLLSTEEIVKLINEEDQTVALSVQKAIPQIVALIDQVVASFEKGGRLIYLGAGTSGRIGLIDATECPPTYGVDPSMVTCLMAGGLKAMTHAVEGAEDSLTLGIEDLKSINVNQNDIVVGIAASGRTPYVVSAIEYAKQLNIKTGSITTCLNSRLSQIVDYPIEAVTGAEPITGSTRMKSGTAQKMICNMISTTAMIKMGKVYQNLMVDVQATNEKLISRAKQIIVYATGADDLTASHYLEKYQTVKKAILAYLSGIEDQQELDRLINHHQGRLRPALKEAMK